MNSRRYGTPQTAATNLIELLEYLSKDEKSKKYAYRGQTKEYENPLLPSAFRLLLTSQDNYIDSSHPFYKYSLRKYGNVFYGDHNYKIHKSVDQLFTSLSSDQVANVRKIFNKVLNGTEIAFLQVTSRLSGQLLDWFESLERSFSQEDYNIYIQYIKDNPQYSRVIDRFHRRMIRNFFFYYFFSFLIATCLSQQYGISSEGLDATASLDVAAFFATHDSHDDYTYPAKEGIGLIYRLPYETKAVNFEDLNYYDFNTLPPVMDIFSLLLLLENDKVGINNMLNSFQSFGSNIKSGRNKVYLSQFLPKGTVELSRAGRQKAIIIFPDQIRRDQRGSLPGVDGLTKSQFQYIEDISTRNGLEKYYFHHTGALPDKFSITREYLWPADDPLLPLICSGITAAYPMNLFEEGVLPYRLDLIDGGYNKQSFLNNCIGFAKKNNFLGYFTQEQISALAKGTIII